MKEELFCWILWSSIEFAYISLFLPDVDSPCSEFDHGTPLHIAARCLALNSARELLEFGADPTVRDITGRLAIGKWDHACPLVHFCFLFFFSWCTQRLLVWGLYFSSLHNPVTLPVIIIIIITSHLFLKRPFLPRSARVRRLPRYEAPPHIPEHCPFSM